MNFEIYINTTTNAGGAKDIDEVGTWEYEMNVSPSSGQFASDGTEIDPTTIDASTVTFFYFNVVDGSATNHKRYFNGIVYNDELWIKNVAGTETTKYKVTSVSLVTTGVYQINIDWYEGEFDFEDGVDYRLFGSVVGNNYRRVDLYEDEGIELNRNMIAVSGLENHVKHFSKEFTIPSSALNNSILLHWENKANDSVINPNKAIAARVIVAGVYTIEGNVELMSVTWSNGNPENYSIVFYGNESSLKSLYGDLLMSDLDLSGFYFNYNYANIVASWSNTTDNAYYVPVISWKRWYAMYNPAATAAPNNIASSLTGVLVDELRVGLRLRELVRLCGEKIGKVFTFDSKINTTLIKAFVIPSKYKDLFSNIDDDQYKSSAYGNNNNFVSTGYTECVLTTIILDPRGNFSTATNRYIPEYDGQYTLKLSATRITGTNNCSVTAQLMSDEAGLIADDIVSGTTSWEFLIPAALVKDDHYYIQLISNTASRDVNYNAVFETLSIPLTLYDKEYHPQDYMPIMRISDWLNSFLMAFNCAIIKGDGDEYNIIDVQTIFEDANTIVLNDHVDLKKLTYKKINVYSEIIFSHADGKDAPNILFDDAAGRVFGELDFKPDVDFSDGELKQKSIFTVFPPGYMQAVNAGGVFSGYTSMRHHYNLTNEAEPKPAGGEWLIMYRNEVLTLDNSDRYYLQSGYTGPTPTFTLTNTYGQYSAFQDTTTTVDTNTLTYSQEQPFTPVVAQGTITNRFWKNWLTQLYKRTAYTIQIQFPIDFATYLKFSDIAIIEFQGFFHIATSWKFKTSSNIMTVVLMRYDAINPDTEVEVAERTLYQVESDGILKLRDY